MSNVQDDIIQNRLYLGTLKRYAEPKTSDYWYEVKNGQVVINPETISSQLENAKNKVKDAKNQGRDILIVSDKIACGEEIKVICEEEGYHYFNNSVPAGVFTNFETLKYRIDSMNELGKFIESEDFDKLNKKEKQDKRKEYNKLQNIYKGVKNLTKKPDLVILLDGTYLSNFVRELEKVNIDNIVISSTDFDRFWNENNLVIANTNSYYSINYILNYILK